MLSACGNNNKNNEDCVNFLELSYVKNLKLDMVGKQGLAIKKVSCENNKPNAESSSILLSFSTVAYEEESNVTEKYVLFTTTQTYSTGKVTYDGNSIQQVTFTKNNNTTEDVYDSNGDAQPENESNFTAHNLKYIATNSSNETLVGYYKGNRIENFKQADAKCMIGVENSIYVNDSAKCYWFNTEFNTILMEKDNHLYYKNVVLEDMIGSNTELTIENFTQISTDELSQKSSYYISIDKNKKEVDNVYYKVSSNVTTYYQLVKNGESFSLVQLADTQYTQNVFIFQPINK